MTIKIDELAQRQLKDFRSLNPGTCFSDKDFSLDNKQAYAVQDAVRDCPGSIPRAAWR